MNTGQYGDENRDKDDVLASWRRAASQGNWRVREIILNWSLQKKRCPGRLISDFWHLDPYWSKFVLF